MEKKLEGTYVVTVTPFDEADRVNLDALRELVDYFIENRVDGIFVGGSTGEFAYLTPEEHMAIIETAVNHVNKRVPVLAGTSACATKQSVALSKYAEKAGADGVVVVPPYYHRPTEGGLLNHYRMISNAISIPVMVYNNPAVAKVDMSPELIARLAEFPNVKYVKESSGDITRIWKIRKLTNDRMAVFCGGDNMALESYLMGATGFICVASNFLPRETSEIYRLYREGRLEDARKVYERILPILNFLEDSGKFVQLSKAALNLAGKKVGTARSPLMPLEASEERKLKELLAQLQK
ncbi:MAG TPA: 4-hydroxy-tetrahydrodipicolinate synthase [Nitrososphaerales archaeon]|nr:4-hydroxy-tetrahydrodipicolinate synthase [Nitrososphaerales archaeon]